MTELELAAIELWRVRQWNGRQRYAFEDRMAEVKAWKRLERAIEAHQQTEAGKK